MWESLEFRRLGVPEIAGSNPAILTDEREGQANRHDGTRLESGRGVGPYRFESCPFR